MSIEFSTKIGIVKVTETNYSNSGSKWNGVSVYLENKLISRVKTTAMYGSLNYIKRHPNSQYTKKLVGDLKNKIPDWAISSIIN